MLNSLLLIAGSYLLGSIPFSLLFSKLKGRDPRQGGTKNVGATNALVVAGPLIGGLALIGDIAKGFLAIQLARYFNLSDGGIALCGLAAVAGHDFSLFLNFKGGKGVATSGGVILALDPIFFFLLSLLWLLTMIIVRYFIPSTILVFIFVPIMMWMGSFKPEYIYFGIGAALLSLYAHRDDLRRFFSGGELSISEAIAKYLKK